MKYSFSNKMGADTVDKVTLMDDSFNECDPDNIPEGFSPTSIAIHIGDRLE